MDYSQASERFNFDSFLKRIMESNLIEILDLLNREISNVENIRIPTKTQYKRDIEYLQVEYVSKLKGLAFFLSQGVKPGGVDESTFLKFQPVLIELVKKGQLKESVLKLFE